MARGAGGGKVRELQARLRQIAWLFEGPNGKYGPATTKAVEGFQGKRGLPRTGNTDTVTWARLVKMTHTPTRDELYASGGQPAAKPDRRCMTGRVVCISKTSRTLTWMIDGKALMTTDVRFGSQFTPTREGVFSVYWKSRHHVSTIYHTPMPYAMFFSGGQAVHYSADFAARGYSGASHGCVNGGRGGGGPGATSPPPRQWHRAEGTGGTRGSCTADDQSAHLLLRPAVQKRHTRLGNSLSPQVRSGSSRSDQV
jgi:hypothetical protein